MASIAQVARKAGVSSTTASFVLNGRGKEMRISDAASDKVKEAARELGYRSNYHARTLVRGRAMTLGLVNPYRPGDVFRLAVTTGMMQVARANDYEVLNIGGRDVNAAMQRGLQYVEESRIDGMVVFQEAPLLSDDLSHHRIPLVYIWFQPEKARPVVTLDPAPGIHEAVKHLAELGHRKILWLGMRRDGEFELPERRAAYRSACKDPGLEPREMALPGITGQLSGENSVREFHHILSDREEVPGDCSAVMCFNDRMALALEMALAGRGMKAPDDVSIVGFDDLHAEHGAPPITTISHGLVEMGARATDTVLEMIDDPEMCQDLSESILTVGSRLVIRESTGPAGVN